MDINSVVSNKEQTKDKNLLKKYSTLTSKCTSENHNITNMKMFSAISKSIRADINNIQKNLLDMQFNLKAINYD